MKVPVFGEGIDLYKNYNFMRTFVIGKDRHQLQFVETEEDFEEVTQFLQRNNATFAIFPCQNEGVRTFNEFF
jgi:hypothetical protein